jgi:hypothetical protein
VAPLHLGGIRGKNSTPSVGWEVPGSLDGQREGVAQSTQTTLGAREQARYTSSLNDRIIAGFMVWIYDL